MSGNADNWIAQLKTNKQAILQSPAARNTASRLVDAHEALIDINEKAAHDLNVKDLKFLEWLGSHGGSATQGEIKSGYGMSNNEYCKFVRDRLSKKLKLLNTSRASNGVGRPKIMVELSDEVRQVFT